ncbi:hypothetical protein BsWGS_23681 [Bradybaena similaris]
MTSFKQLVVVCVTMAVGSVVTQQNPPPLRGAPPFRGGGGGGGGSTFTCPDQERRAYEYQGDCTQFYQCERGEPTLIVCPPQLVFNARAGYCDFESEAQNPNCAARESSLPQEVRGICSVNHGGKAGDAFLVPHPQICNAFYTCSPNYLHNSCTFCGEFEYFSLEARGCRSYLPLGTNIDEICQGRRYVQHRDKVFEQLNSCYPYNPFMALLVSGLTTTTQRPG